MIKLSDRLNMIAEEIERGETMADIGTDHGFLPYLRDIRESEVLVANLLFRIQRFIFI